MNRWILKVGVQKSILVAGMADPGSGKLPDSCRREVDNGRVSRIRLPTGKFSWVEKPVHQKR